MDLLDDSRTVQEFSQGLASLTPSNRAAFYRSLEQGLAYSRRHYIDYGGKTNEREDLQALRAACEASPEQEALHAEFLFSLYLLRSANLGLEQVRGTFGVPAVMHLMEQRLDLYAVHDSKLAQEALRSSTLGLGRKAKILFAARAEVSTGHYRVSLIDGKAWYRTEALLPRVEVAAAPYSKDFLLALASFCDWPEERMRADVAGAAVMATRRAIEQHGELAPLLAPVMQAIVDDPHLGVDTAVLTCPAGTGLEAPSLLAEPIDSPKNFRCFVVFRTGMEPPDMESKATTSARKAIRGRMFKLKRKAAKNCDHASLLFGVDVEKAHDYMVYANEDTHYPGHKAARVFTGGRASIKLTVPERNIDLSRGFCDLRCFRGREGAKIFTVNEERWIIRYAEVLQVMLTETLRLGSMTSNEVEEE